MATTPPDGGWGWCIVFGASLIHLLFGMLLRGIGVYYIEFLNHFDTSATVTAWLVAVSMGLFNALGPLVTSACARFGCRRVVYVGTVLYSLGFILTGLATSIIVTYVTFGVILGSALCLIYTPGYVLVSEYFDKRKASALALSTLGSAFGAFLGPPLVQFLFSYYGYFGAFLLLGGLGLHAGISATLYRSVEQHHRIMAVKRRWLQSPAELDVEVNPQSGLVKNDCADNTGTENDNLIDQEKQIINIPNKVELDNEDNDKCSVISKTSVGNDLVFSESPDTVRNPDVATTQSDINHVNHVSTAVTAPNHTPGGPNRKKRKVFDFSLMRDLNFLLLSLTYMMMSVCLAATITFLPSLALDRGIGRWRAVFLLSVLGIADGLVRIPLGVFFDVKIIRPHRTDIYMLSLVAAGIVTALLPVFSNYWVMVTLCVLRGIVTSMIMPQRMTIMGDMFGVARAPSGLGIQMLTMAIGSILIRLMGGLFKDYLGVYDPVFYIGGVLLSLTSGAMFLVLHLQKRNQREREKSVVVGELLTKS